MARLPFDLEGTQTHDDPDHAIVRVLSARTSSAPPGKEPVTLYGGGAWPVRCGLLLLVVVAILIYVRQRREASPTGAAVET